MSKRVSQQPVATFPGMTFGERHPWMVMRLGMDADYIPRRFSNEHCAAHSVQLYGPSASKYQLRHAVTGRTYSWIECLDLSWTSEGQRYHADVIK